MDNSPKSMSRTEFRRHLDFQIINDWIDPNSRVLDLGCGRGILLEHLQREKNVTGIGVDSAPEKILGCVKRGVSAYQGDIEPVLGQFPDGFFDWVICSQTLPELTRPARIIEESLRVGQRLAMAFVNHGYWLNRWNMARYGHRVINEVYPRAWYHSNPSNPVSVRDFEGFCRTRQFNINRAVYLRGDWRNRCSVFPNLLAGYVLYDLSR